MRIIGGTWRSRRLLRPETDSTRPMPDRVKQSIFDMLGSRYDCPGALPPLLVADVFAGGGSMGLEALSRGAAYCSFFERDRDALATLRRNVESLGAGRESSIIPGDAWRAGMTTPDGRPFGLIFLDPPYRDCEDTSGRGAVRRFLGRLVLRHSQTFGLGGMPKPGASDEPTEGQTSRPRREGPGGSAGRRHVRPRHGGASLGHATREPESDAVLGDDCLVVLHHPAGRPFVLADDDPWRVVEERRVGSNAVTFFVS